MISWTVWWNSGWKDDILGDVIRLVQNVRLRQLLLGAFRASEQRVGLGAAA